MSVDPSGSWDKGLFCQFEHLLWLKKNCPTPHLNSLYNISGFYISEWALGSKLRWSCLVKSWLSQDALIW